MALILAQSDCKDLEGSFYRVSEIGEHIMSACQAQAYLEQQPPSALGGGVAHTYMANR